MSFGSTLTSHLLAMLVMRMLRPDLPESGPAVIAAAADAMAASCYRESIISAGDETQALRIYVDRGWVERAQLLSILLWYHSF